MPDSRGEANLIMSCKCVVVHIDRAFLEFRLICTGAAATVQRFPLRTRRMKPIPNTPVKTLATLLQLSRLKQGLCALVFVLLWTSLPRNIDVVGWSPQVDIRVYEWAVCATWNDCRVTGLLLVWRAPLSRRWTCRRANSSTVRLIAAAGVGQHTVCWHR